MIFQTGLVGTLASRGHRVGVVVPDATDAQLVASAAKAGVELIELPGELTPVQAQMLQFRRYLLDDLEANPALYEKHMQRANDPERRGLRRLQTRLGWWAYRAQRKLPPLRTAYRALEKRLLYSSAVEAKLRELNPRLVVATYPVFPPEFQLLAAARRLGTATAIHLLSWDNITSKGIFPALADDYIAWGPIMAAELREYYGVHEAKIHRCGVPHFDLHRESVAQPDREGYLSELGLDPNRPYLFHAMSAPRFAPREIDVVEWIARRVGEGAFGGEMQFVVRPHPQNMTGYMADHSWVDRLRELNKLDHVAINYPGLVEASGMPWSMQQEDMRILSQLLAGSAVVTNIGSTVSIDALMCGRPVVLTSFDAGEELPYWTSARRLLDFTHLRKFVAGGGVEVARSFEELETMLRAYLTDPERKLALRQATLEAEVYRPDGQATRRVADALEQLLATP